MRSYLDAADAATAFLYILTHGKSCNAYNVTNMENEISIRDMALKMIEISKSPVQLIVEKGRSESKLGFRKEGHTVMNASKLMTLGWSPVYTLKETILSLIQYKKSSLDVFQIRGGARRILIGQKYREHGYLVEKWDKIIV